MKRVIIAWFTVTVIFFAACTRSSENKFFCTQERVCNNEIFTDKYGFSVYAKDSGIVIPGLKQNFIPQGLGYWDRKDWLVISGYFMPISENKASALLAVDLKTGALAGEYTLVDDQGKELGGHFSGITFTQEDLYVTGKNCLYRVPLSEMIANGRKGDLKVSQTIPVAVSADSCTYSGDLLWVCEYYHPETFPLTGSHISICDDGTKQHAWMVGYQVLNGDEYLPECVISVPDRVQGVAILNDGRVLISQSYGRKNHSNLLVYQDPRCQEPDAAVRIGDREVPLWNLEMKSLEKSLSAPPMAEGCCQVGDRLFLIFESAAYYYRSFDPKNCAVDPTDSIWFINMKNRAPKALCIYLPRSLPRL